MVTNPQVDGDPNAPLLVLGMAPGRHEVDEGRPFVGPSGSLLWSLAARAGFSRADCYIINTIGEPQAGDGGPSPAEFARWWEDFDRYLSQSRAKAVLCLGGDAFYRLTGIAGRDHGISDWRGYLVYPSDFRTLERQAIEQTVYKRSTATHKKGDPRLVKRTLTVRPFLPETVKVVIPSFHPAAVIRSGYKSTTPLAYDIDRAWRATAGKLILFADNRTNTLPTSTGAIAIDIETTHSIIGGEFINRIGVATLEGTWTSPWTPNAKETLQSFLDHASTIVVHNAPFDIPRLERSGLRISRAKLYDSMFACQLLQPDLPKGLNFVSSMYLDTPRWKHLSETDPSKYNALDAAAALALYFITYDELRNHNLLSFYQSVIVPGLSELMDMSTYGLKVDEPAAIAWRASLEVREKALIELWNTHHPTVSITSHAQLKTLYYDKLKYPVQKSHDGKVTIDERALKVLASKVVDPSLTILLDFRKINKQRTTFAKVTLGADGCVHPSYLPRSKDKDNDQEKGVAGTGRIQASNPNIMQQPQSARRIYIPHHPSLCFLEFDYDQAELRVVAALARDPRLQSALDGPDVHQVHADRWGCSRKDAKIVTYATLYGARERKLQLVFQRMGISLAQRDCARLQSAFFTDYPSVRNWQSSILATLDAERRLVNPFGRVRYFWHPRSDAAAGLDYLPQSTIADIMWTTLAPLSTLVKSHGGRLITIVHDSYLLEVPRRNALDIAAEIQRLLTQEYSNVAPGFFLPVSFRGGADWSACSREDDTFLSSLRDDGEAA